MNRKISLHNILIIVVSLILILGTSICVRNTRWKVTTEPITQKGKLDLPGGLRTLGRS
jgi:branched-subunit amino acid ABC-type transport system permease component